MIIELRRLALLGLFALFFGWSIGYPLEIFTLAAGLYMIWTFVTINRLFHWIDQGMKGKSPDAQGVWGEISDTLTRQKRRHRRSRAALQRIIDRMSSISDSVDEGMLVLNSDLTLDWWNKAAGDYLGFQQMDRHSSILNLIRSPQFVDYMQVRKFAEPLTIMWPAGTGRILSFTVSSFGHEELVLVIDDVTRLSNLDRIRKDFVANVSHELRTPLTVLRGYLEMLSERMGEQEPLVQKGFIQMSEQVTRIQSLADDLIILSRLESESGIAAPELINLRQLLAAIVDEAELLGQGKHPVELICPDALEVTAQPGDLHSAFGNLVFNAIQHNPQGASIVIEAAERLNILQISVRDDGIGIDPEKIPRLTERFYRVDNSRNSTSGGSGLGLAIVKHVVERYEGTLTIKSLPGHGAEFICRFPRRALMD